MIRYETRIVVCLSCLMSLPTLFGANENVTPEQVKEEARLRINARRAAQDAIMEVQQISDEYLVKAQDAQATLEKIQSDTKDLLSQVKTLETSDEGKRIATDPILLIRIRNVKNRPVTTLAKVTSRLNRVSSYIQRMESHSEGPVVGALPPKELRDNIDEQLFWARDASKRLSSQLKELEMVSGGAPKETDPAKSRPLGKVLDEYDAKWPIVLAESDILGTELAYGQSRQLLVDAVVASKLAMTLAEVERIKAENQMLIKQMHAEAEILRLKMDSDLQRKLNEAKTVYEDEIARLNLELEKAKAKREQTVVQEEREIQKVQNETARLRLLKEVESLEVRQLLENLFEPGYWEPGSYNGSVRRQPMSLDALGKFGALSNTIEGHSRLLFVLTTTDDKDRTRWPLSKRLDSITSQQRDSLVQAQELLIKLGKTMVKQKLLSE
jgi:hypothetical protein